ncbi:MAG: hypothetical protein O7C59_08690 [Rickettsia endosymbiont of Ixodes persulcatus]|nr:hypothetical protein [Rickettsia endosymbiont of Ixodes persulcatus]
MAVLLVCNLLGSGVLWIFYVVFWICSLLVIAVLWKWILAFIDGAVSIVLGYSVEWLIDFVFALPVVFVVIVWINVGYVILFFFVGILVISWEIQDVVRIDGVIFW